MKPRLRESLPPTPCLPRDPDAPLWSASLFFKFYLLSSLFNRPSKLVCFVFPMMPLCLFINLCVYMHGRTGFALLHLSYIVLALSSTVTKLPNKTLLFHDFQGPTIIFHDFPGLENEILKFNDFPSFPLPLRTLEIRWHLNETVP